MDSLSTCNRLEIGTVSGIKHSLIIFIFQIALFLCGLQIWSTFSHCIDIEMLSDVIRVRRLRLLWARWSLSFPNFNSVTSSYLAVSGRIWGVLPCPGSCATHDPRAQHSLQPGQLLLRAPAILQQRSHPGTNEPPAIGEWKIFILWRWCSNREKSLLVVRNEMTNEHWRIWRPRSGKA